MKQSKNTTSRRAFVKKIAAGAALLTTSGPAILTGKNDIQQYSLSRLNPYSANDQVQIALIGAGGMGTADTDTALQVPGVRLVAVCDLYTGRLEDAKGRWGKDLFTTKDYREILNRSDVDAVIVATPDHWHMPISVEALNKGKGVYCEKPMVHDVTEGAAVVQAQQKSGKTFQVGSQGLSSLGNEKAKELFESGAIGQFIYAEGFWARNSPVGAWQYAIPQDASPDTVDWDRYIANTTKRAFDPLRFFRWRNYRDYGTGIAGDLFVHQFSGIHFVMNSLGPQRVCAMGGTYFWKDGRDVPDLQMGMFDYPETGDHPPFQINLRVNFEAGGTGGSDGQGFRFVGTDGVLNLSVGNALVLSKRPRQTDPGTTAETFPKAIAKQIIDEHDAKYPRKGPSLSGMQPVTEERFMMPPGYSEQTAHPETFFNAIRSRTPVTEDAVFGLRAAGPALLANMSYFERRIVDWDPVKMRVKG